MGKAFGLILLMIGIYVVLNLHAKSMEQASSSLFAPIAPSERESPIATHLTPIAQSADAPTGGAVRPRERVTDAVRNKVTADLQAGAARHTR